MNTLSTTSAKVLIVDDSASIRLTLKGFFASANIDVIGEAVNGLKLLQIIAETSPDIICLDYYLPGINGFELLKSIVAEFPHVSVVMVTGEIDPNFRSAVADAGGAGFIHKPFTYDQVISEVTHVIHAKQLIAHATKQSAKTTTNGPLAQSTKRKTAIIADDSKTMRELLKVILANQHVEVLAQATNGVQAVELSIEHRPDLLCLDIDMPGMNGLDALAAIRQKVTSTKVLMITGNSKRETVMSTYKLGAAGFILKPFDPDKIAEIIAKVLSD